MLDRSLSKTSACTHYSLLITKNFNFLSNYTLYGYARKTLNSTITSQVVKDFKIRSICTTSLSANYAKTLLAKLEKGDRGWLRLNLSFEEWAAIITDNRWRQKLYQQYRLMETPQLNIITINLSQWFQGKFTLGWQPLTELINSATGISAYALRSLETSVALLIGMNPEKDNKMGIKVQLHPTREKNHLPTNLRLALLNQSGDILQEFAARNQDELIQLKRFTCPRKKRFSIRVALNSYSITEEFSID